LGTRIQELHNIKKHPSLVLIGILANTLIPLIYITLFQMLGQFWHSHLELQHILVGLALVAAMPIAGSSTAWSQNVNGNLALSLGLVVISTMISPWTTPLVLHAIGFLASGEYAEALHNLAKYGTGAFLTFSVVFPSLLGLGARHFIGERRIRPFSPYLKFFNLLNLLLLSYSNAAISLPQAFHNPDWDFLILIITVTTGLCLLAFGAGWLISRLYHTTRAEQSSLMFGLGMNNNGTGLVLSSMALAQYPLVMVPIIFYNLSQQVIAGLVDAKVTRDNRYL
jgi:BASS family bile acid:Na+ symporter